MPHPVPDLHKRPQSLSSVLLVVALLCAAAVTATSWLVPDPSPGATTTLGAAAVVPPLLAVVLCLRAARRVPAERYAWWATAAAWACYISGDLVHAVAGPSDPPFPSVADAFWLAGYPALFAAPLLLLRARLARPRASTWLDGVIGALGITAVSASALITPALAEPGLGTVALAGALTYPVADLLLVALVGAVLAVVGLRGDVVVAAICLVLVLKFAGDLLVTQTGAAEGSWFSGPVAFVWSLNACLTAAAAAATAPRRRIRAHVARTSLGWQSLLIPVLCTAVSLVVLGVEWGDRTTSVGEVCALGCLAAFLARAVVSFLEGRALHDAHRQARTDDLTGLPNRRALMGRLERRLTAQRPTALLLLDLDGFKAVNDGLGHAAGDELLRLLGERLRPGLRPDDVLARLGGDEFAVLLRTDDAAVVTACAERLDDLVRRPLVVAGTPVQVGVSIGVATSPEHAGDASALLRCADAAMYAAKSRDGGVGWYVPAPPPAATAGTVPRPRGEAGELRFRVVTGPDGQVVAAEAVTAGRGRPVEKLAGPDRVAEVLAAAAGWWTAHPVPVQLGVTATDLAIPRLPDLLTAALLRAGLPPAALEVRLLPTAVAVDESAAALLAALRVRGLLTVAEPAGRGTAAFAALGDQPADRIRLDAHLARRTRDDQRAALVVAHTVALATALGIGVVVDAVDAETDADLARQGCVVLRSDGALLSAEDLADRLAEDRAARLQAPTAEPTAEPAAQPS